MMSRSVKIGFYLLRLTIAFILIATGLAIVLASLRSYLTHGFVETFYFPWIAVFMVLMVVSLFLAAANERFLGISKMYSHILASFTLTLFVVIVLGFLSTRADQFWTFNLGNIVPVFLVCIVVNLGVYVTRRVCK